MIHLILAALAVLPLYLAWCLIKPTKGCRRCGGWGSNPGRRRSARRQCHRCHATGQRFRAGARLVYRVRGAIRRHAQLTAQAEARAAKYEQEQMRS